MLIRLNVIIFAGGLVAQGSFVLVKLRSKSSGVSFQKLCANKDAFSYKYMKLKEGTLNDI